MKLYSRLLLFFAFISIFIIGICPESKALTSSEVETYTQQALSDYLQAQGWQSFNHGSSYGDLAGVSYLLSQNAWTQKKPDIPFENYDSFVWLVVVTGSSTSHQTHVILQLFNDLDFTITARGGYLSSVPINYINCTTNNSGNITSYRFISGVNSDNFSFNNDISGSLDTTMNRFNYQSIIYTTGEIYNTQNLLFFGGKLNSINPLEYSSLITNISTFRGTTTRVMFDDIYRYKSIQIGNVIPNDAVRYSIDLKNENSIVVGNYDNSTGLGGSNFGNNALQYSYENNIIISPLYLDYNVIYLLDIEYQVEYGGQSYYDGSTFVLCPTTSYIDNGAIVITSGDFTTQDNAIQIINNSNDNNDFWKGIYDGLFTLQSGDVQDIYNSIEDKFTSGDTPLFIYDTILRTINSSDDFIISWGNIPLHLTINNGEDLINQNVISGDSINFSALCRTNSTLAICKFWVNTMLSFSAFVLIFFGFYKCLLAILGVTPSLIDAMDDDEETTMEVSSETLHRPSAMTGLGRVTSTTTITRRRRLK